MDLYDAQGERIEGGLTTELDVLALDMDDEAILKAVDRVSSSEQFWNSKLQLDSKRDLAESFYLNSVQEELYDYQFTSEYKDNRIFTAIETLVSLVTSRPPQPLVTQAYDTEASYELAQQLQKTILSKYEDLYLKREFQLIARHLLMGLRIGVMKCRWDKTKGSLQEDGSRFGDLDVRTVRPQRIVIDAGAQDVNDIPLIAEYRSDILEDLLMEYPDSASELLRESGLEYGQKPSLTKRIGYLEVHFTTKDKETSQNIEAIVWKYKNIVLDKTKTPFWNYEDDTQNYLSKPQKPYILFNYLNLGRWVIDDTSLMDQAQTLQKIHDKRGRQIVENADQANGGWVFNTIMVNEKSVSAWNNNPGDKILASGNVNDAVARFPAPILPDYVLQDKIDARNEIDNIFGTHGAIKGEVTNNKTLGQDVLSQRGDSARLNTLATAMEDGADRLYKFMTQVMKVFYNVPQLVRFDSETEKTYFFRFGSQHIDPGVAIRVKSGSVLPNDPIAEKQDAKELAAILDPLNLAKALNRQNPKEWAKQVTMYRLLPDKYLTEVLGFNPETSMGTSDGKALSDIQLIIMGQSDISLEKDITKEYLATFQAFLTSAQFKALNPQTQQAIIAHFQKTILSVKSAMGMQNEQENQPQVIEQQNQPQLMPGGTPDQAQENPLSLQASVI